jgi:hypothetical protein
MKSEDKLKEALIKIAEKPKAASMLLKTLKDAVHKDKLESQIKSVLIKSIHNHDKLIQAYVEEDQAKTIDELTKLSFKNYLNGLIFV